MQEVPNYVAPLFSFSLFFQAAKRRWQRDDIKAILNQNTRVSQYMYDGE